MDENEYLLQHLMRQRLREAEQRGALESMLREAGVSDAKPTSSIWRWLARRRAAVVPFASQADGSALG